MAHSHIPSVFEAKRKLAEALGRPLPQHLMRGGTSGKASEKFDDLARDPKSKYPHLFQFYCPLCGVAKRLPFSPQPGARHFLQVGLTALVTMLAFWPLWGIKGVVVFLPYWMIFEFAYRARVRARMRCTQCGFDPFLYMTDVGRARREVQDHWRKLFEARGLEYPPPVKHWWEPEMPKPAPADQKPEVTR